jgi:hypothetical protein
MLQKARQDRLDTQDIPNPTYRELVLDVLHTFVPIDASLSKHCLLIMRI